MNITEYYETIRASIQKRMPDVILQMETKPGDRTCIRISREGEKVSPVLCLEGYYDSYINGRALEETVQDILHDWENSLKYAPDISADDINNWKKAKHRIFLMLTADNAFQSEERLGRNWLDMKLTVRYCVSSQNDMLQSFPVPVKLAREIWHVPEEEIFNTAEKNTETYFTPSLKSLFQILSGVISAMEEKTNWNAAEMIHGSEPLSDSLYVLSNCYNLYGATAICYKGLLAGLYRRFGRAFYIIPCSINETILFPEPEDDDMKMQFNPKKMREIIFEVNRSTIEPKERLSDSLYYFDGQELTIAGMGGNDDE